MYIMSGNVSVVEYDREYSYKIMNHDLVPIYIKNRGDIKKWISERALNAERANSRAIKAVMGLSRTASDYMAAMKVDAATITDNFWVKDENDERTYEDIAFSTNDFFSLALYRDVSCLDIKASRTPELTI